MGGIHQLFDWLATLAYVNILWLLYSLAGMFIFGFGPATVSVFTVIRNKLRGKDNNSIWSQFYQTYRKEFLHVNKLMIIVYIVFIFLYLDFTIIQSLPYSFLVDNIVFPALMLLSFLVVFGISYLFAVYVHFDLSFLRRIKLALLMIGLYPLSTLIMGIGLVIFFFVLFIFPAIAPFYIVSVPALIILMSANRTFDKLMQAKLYRTVQGTNKN